MVNRYLHHTRRPHAEEGFTLIELLIVIVVLGILAGIVVFGVSTFRSDSISSACGADMKQVQTAAEAYNATKSVYPADMAALVTAKYLKNAPASTNYSITYTGNGATTVNGVAGFTGYTIHGASSVGTGTCPVDITG